MKNRLREIFKLKREYFKPSLSDLNNINQNLQSVIAFLNFEYVMSYSPLAREVDIKETNNWILNSKELYFPKVKNKELEVFKIENLEKDLEKGSFKILEPKDSCLK